MFHVVQSVRFSHIPLSNCLVVDPIASRPDETGHARSATHQAAATHYFRLLLSFLFSLSPTCSTSKLLLIPGTCTTNIHYSHLFRPCSPFVPPPPSPPQSSANNQPSQSPDHDLGFTLAVTAHQHHLHDEARLPSVGNTYQKPVIYLASAANAIESCICGFIVGFLGPGDPPLRLQTTDDIQID